MPNLRTRFWIEAGLGLLAGFLAILTMFWRDWIEALTGFDPDRRSGSVEWLIVAALFLVCAGAVAAAWVEWRRPPGELAFGA